jgi:hypothetical protein
MRTFAIVAAAFLAAAAATSARASSLPTVPDDRLTPGVVTGMSQAQICAVTWGHDRRHVTHAMKALVAGWYHVADADWPKVEFDHRIPRSVGGADAVGNLWPERRGGAEGAGDKDRLEAEIHRRLCVAKTMDLAEAQAAFRGDWRRALAKYAPAPAAKSHPRSARRPGIAGSSPTTANRSPAR